MNRYRILLTAFFAFSFSFSLNGEDYRSILEKADSLASYPDSDFSAEYTIVHEKAGTGTDRTVSAVFRRDSDSLYTIIVTEPSINRGQGYLKLNDTLWFYDPEGRRFNFTSSKERFQNSNARNSDFTRSTLAQDYDVVSASRTILGKYSCWLFDLEANNDQVTYPKMKIWISDDYLVRKTEDYSLSGQLLRTTAIPAYQVLDGRYIPRSIYFFEALVDEKTVLSIAKPSFRTIPDSVFTKNFLEKSSQ